MTRLRRASTFLLLGTAFSGELQAQGLAAAAEKERQRRAQQNANGTAKSFSDEDLGRVGAPLANDTSIPPAAGASAAQAGSADSRGGTQSRGESYWSSRSKQLRVSVAAAEQRLQEAERAARDVRLGNCREVTRPRPAGVTSYPGVQSRERQCDAAAPVANQGQSQVDSARAALQRARQELASLEDQARRDGALPGWVR